MSDWITEQYDEKRSREFYREILKCCVPIKQKGICPTQFGNAAFMVIDTKFRPDIDDYFRIIESEYGGLYQAQGVDVETKCFFMHTPVDLYLCPAMFVIVETRKPVFLRYSVMMSHNHDSGFLSVAAGHELLMFTTTEPIHDPSVRGGIRYGMSQIVNVNWRSAVADWNRTLYRNNLTTKGGM